MSMGAEQIGILEFVREKNRLGRGSNLGHVGGICASGAPNDFSRLSEMHNTHIHYPEVP
jgi:hypothetical protein